MLPFLDKKQAVTEIVSKLDKNGQLQNVEEGEESNVDLDKDGLRMAAGDVINSLHMKDESRFLASMKALMQLLQDND